MDTAATLTSGAQSVRRALGILRLLSEHHAQGLRVRDVIELSGLERSTAHRILTCLVEERFVEQDAASKVYHLGVNSMQMGLATMRKFPLVASFRPTMQRLARITGDTVFLLLRDGDFTLCLHREEGPFPIKALTTDIGNRRLLGLGTSGLALLAALEDVEIEAFIARNGAALQSRRMDPKILWHSIQATRKAGHSEVVDTLTKGVSGVGVVIPAPDGRPGMAAVSIGAITTRLGPARRLELGQLLRESIQAFLARRRLR